MAWENYSPSVRVFLTWSPRRFSFIFHFWNLFFHSDDFSSDKNRSSQLDSWLANFYKRNKMICRQFLNLKNQRLGISERNIKKKILKIFLFLFGIISSQMRIFLNILNSHTFSCFFFFFEENEGFEVKIFRIGRNNLRKKSPTFPFLSDRRSLKPYFSWKDFGERNFCSWDK